MAVDGYGSAADHAALSGLGVGDPHLQYTRTLWGTAAARPAQPIREGTRYLATDTNAESVSTGTSWLDVGDTTHLHTVTRYNPADANTLPRTYPEGLSRTYFARGAAGFPAIAYWSVVLTLRFGNDIRQTAYEVGELERVWSRVANSGADAWTSWDVTTAGKGDSAWRNVGAAGEPAYQNGWLTYDATYAPARFRKSNGVVYVQGMIRSGTLGAIAFTLPAGYRPNFRLLFDANGFSSQCRVDVESTGGVTMVNARQEWTSLDGISFPADQ